MRRNEEISAPQLRVIAADGSQAGVMSRYDALQMASSAELDLVEVSPTAEPPVVRIMDYGKFRFEQSRREKEARKNQRVAELKEIKLSVGIDKHDFDTKVGHALRFLEQGHKVKVFIRFRGREMAHANLATDKMKAFAESCAEIASVERVPKLEGRQMIMFLAPKDKPKK